MGTLLSLSKSATSFALDASEIALLLFGLVVVIGVAGEVAKGERWKPYVRLFEVLVIFGVAGELLADGGIFLFSKHLQTIAELEIAELTKTAGNAKASAEGAANAASRANTAAGDALDKSNAAKDAASKAQEKVDEVAIRADRLRKDLDKIEEKRKEMALFFCPPLVKQL